MPFYFVSEVIRNTYLRRRLSSVYVTQKNKVIEIKCWD